jgi:polar amino acid transport system permease protein
MITVIELSGAAKIVATKYFMYNESFLAVGLVYLALVSLTTCAVHLLEKRVAVPGLSTGHTR